MKHIIICVIAFAYTLLNHAQIAYNHDPSPYYNHIREISYRAVTNVAHIDYFKATAAFKDCKRITFLEKKVAQFNITKQPVFKNPKKSYTVVFKENENYKGQIIAKYDKVGKLIETNERFCDIRLPRIIRSCINSNFPGAIIQSNLYVLSYSENKRVLEFYKVKIDHNGKKETVKIDTKGNII
ncbi:hypothetical protein [Gaetbulibacter saemankumensis]|uniref:hypothetical protein n=1 Tax=Gaetbulibacter saemankumensis TaxID=311208 RepID=UPI00041C87F4|nr:hypothetical protein [Gaetbulibacter saemankumensis]